MRMTIDRMVIQNFKGCRNLEIDFGSITSIKGMNGTGKSTIADAFTWVLFNKDSHGNAPGSDTFREKPLDEDGKEIHNLDTTVKLFCKLDGKPFNLVRTQRENWVKKRGSSMPVYQGNVSTYWINEVETKLSDFKAAIAQITSEEVFRLIASLSAFNQIEWKKRREQLLALAGSDVDDALLARDEYRPIADEIARRGIGVDDLRKVLTDQRKRTNEQLKMIPVRIDEAKKALPEFGEREISDAEYIINDCQKDIANIDTYISQARAQDGGGNGRMKVLALEQELISLKRRVMDEHNAGLKALKSEADLASEAFRRAGANLSEQKKKLEADKKRLEDATAKRNALREQFSAKRNEVLPAVETVCPYCGQDMPIDSVEKAREQQEKERKTCLDKIREDGKAASAVVVECEQVVADCQAEVDSLQGCVDIALRERDEAFEKVKAYPSEPDFSTEPRIADVEAEIEQAKVEQTTSPDEKIRQYEERKRELQGMIDKKRAVLARRDAGIETEKRIVELEKLQVEYGAQVTELENLIMLVEKFVTDRCGALEESINEKFPNIRWKLFDVQINGGIVDCCVCMIPCDSGLVSYECANTAAQVNADMEIINVLSKHYDVYVPMFLDNAERINVIPHMETQTITLSVSTDEKMKVDYAEAKQF